VERQHRSRVLPFSGPDEIITIGLGSIISRVADMGNFPALLAGTIVMASIVVTVNRMLWRRLYALASGRFSVNGGMPTAPGHPDLPVYAPAAPRQAAASTS